MSSSKTAALFSNYQISDLRLENPIVVASMTRGRAQNAQLAPTALHVQYYGQRAAAGLTISEATWISPQSIGYINVPGLYTQAQIEGWTAVTDAVHARGGKIFAQLAHSGAVSRPDFYAGELPVAPSAVNPNLRAFTPSGFKETVTPRAMTLEDIKSTVRDYGAAAWNAIKAGFDGVELHALPPTCCPSS